MPILIGVRTMPRRNGNGAVVLFKYAKIFCGFECEREDAILKRNFDLKETIYWVCFLECVAKDFRF